MFYGANRTGRWSGRIIQLQNLPQNHMPDLDDARKLLCAGDYGKMCSLYDDIPDVLSQLIRTTFVSRTGYHFCVADFSAIEAKVIFIPNGIPVTERAKLLGHSVETNLKYYSYAEKDYLNNARDILNQVSASHREPSSGQKELFSPMPFRQKKSPQTANL